jgi:hypothetical protein
VLEVWLLSLLTVGGILLMPVPKLLEGVAAVAGRWRLDLGLHVLLFGWLMLVPHAAEWGRKSRVGLSMFLTATAAVLEAAQGASNHRTMALENPLASLCGILLGAWAGRQWRGGRRSRMKA